MIYKKVRGDSDCEHKGYADFYKTIRKPTNNGIFNSIKEDVDSLFKIINDKSEKSDSFLKSLDRADLLDATPLEMKFEEKNQNSEEEKISKLKLLMIRWFHTK